MKRRAIAVMLAAASGACGCGTGARASNSSVAAASPVSPDVISAPVAFFDHAASVQRALRRSYACTVAPPGRGPAILYLVSPARVAEARSLVAASRFPKTEIKVGWAQRARYKLLPIIKTLSQSSLHYPGPTQIDFETASQSECPRIQISLEPRSRVNARLLHWAETEARHYGSDRVAIDFNLVPKATAGGGAAPR